MLEKTFKFKIKDNLMHKEEAYYSTEDSVNYIKAQFEFENETWEEFQTTAIFKNTVSEKSIAVILNIENNIAITSVPPEVLTEAGFIEVSLRGVSENQTITTNKVRFLNFDTLEIDETTPEGQPNAYDELLVIVKENQEDIEELKQKIEEGGFDDGTTTTACNVTVGYENATFICKKGAINNNIQFQNAIDYVSAMGGGTIKVLPGEYIFNKVVYLQSNIHIDATDGVRIKLADQYIAELPSPTLTDTSIVYVGKEIFNNLSVGMEIGFTDGSIGYVLEGEHAHHDFIDSMDSSNFSITIKKTCDFVFTTICTLNSVFRASDRYQGALNNISIIGGEYDGNKANSIIKIADMCQNGLIFEGVSNLIIRDVFVHDFKFQGIHVCGEWITDIYNYESTWVVDNCIVNDCDASGICIDSGRDCSVLNCKASGNTNSGLQLVATKSTVVIGGDYSNNTFCGIRGGYSGSSREDIKIIGATINGNQRGIGIFNINKAVISNCIGNDNTEAGVYLENDCVNILVDGCVLASNKVGIIESSAGTSGNMIIGINNINNITDYQVSSATVISHVPDTSNLVEKEDFESFKNAVLGEQIVDESVDNTIITNVMFDTVNYKLPETTTLPATITSRSKNLFNYANYLGNTETLVGYRGYRITGLKPSTNYTCSTSATSGNTLYFGLNLTMGVDQNGGTYTAQSNSDGEIYIWILEGRSNYDGMIDGSIWIQVEEGEVETEYTPFEVITSEVYAYEGEISSVVGENVTFTVSPHCDFIIIQKSIVEQLKEVFQSVSNGKALIASAITDMGVATPSDATFETMAKNILLIQSSEQPIEPEPNYIFKWDFTKSIVDEIQSQSATLTGCTRTNSGLVIDAGGENCLLGNVFGLGRTLEIDIANAEAQFGNGIHGRFIMIYQDGQNMSEGLVYRHQTQAWAFYVNGAWDSDLPITDKNYFSGKRIKFVSDASGYITLYANDEFVATSGRAFDSTRTMVSLGGYADSYYDVTITGVSIY